MKFDRSRYSNRVEFALATGPVKAWMSVDRYRLDSGQAIVDDSTFKEVEHLGAYGHILQPKTDIRVQTELRIGLNQSGQHPIFETGHAPGTPSFGFLQTFESCSERHYAVSLMAERTVYNRIIKTLSKHAGTPGATLGWEIEVVGLNSEEFKLAEIEYLPVVGFSLVLDWSAPTDIQRDET